jgi:hypothetical protein
LFTAFHLRDVRAGRRFGGTEGRRYTYVSRTSTFVGPGIAGERKIALGMPGLLSNTGVADYWRRNAMATMEAIRTATPRPGIPLESASPLGSSAWATSELRTTRVAVAPLVTSSTS